MSHQIILVAVGKTLLSSMNRRKESQSVVIETTWHIHDLLECCSTVPKYIKISIHLVDGIVSINYQAVYNTSLAFQILRNKSGLFKLPMSTSHSCFFLLSISLRVNQACCIAHLLSFTPQSAEMVSYFLWFLSTIAPVKKAVWTGNLWVRPY